jgi:hypothetical protein
VSALLVSNHLKECSAARHAIAHENADLEFSEALGRPVSIPGAATAAEITVVESSAQRFVFDRRMSEMGQTRHFERGPMTSGLP